MMMGMTMAPRMEHKIETSHRLSMTQSHMIQLEMLNRRRNLAAAVSGTKYEPKGTCPRCAYKLNHLEILKGFLPDPLDITTKCPRCEERFKPKLYADVNLAGRSELAYLCPEQTLAQISGWHELSPREIEQKSTAAYHSAMVNFGSLKAAFEKLGVKYKLETNSSWSDRVLPFLGELPDSVIAQYAGVSRSTIRRLRVRKGVKAFKYRSVLDELN